MANQPRGIDVSVYQGKINWKEVESSGLVQFVYVRASIGLSSDSNFKQNWEGIAGTNMFRGAYHFYRTDSDPIKQAEKFFATVGNLRDNDLPPVLDFEVKKPSGQDVKVFAKNIVSFVNKVEELFQRKAVVYTGGPLFNVEMKGADAEDVDLLSSRDLWLAAYVFEAEKFVPIAWKQKGKSWTLWQFSGDVAAGNKPGMRVPGISTVVDYNQAQGAAEDLNAWVKASYLKKEEPEPVAEPPQEQPVEQPQQAEVVEEQPQAEAQEKVEEDVKVTNPPPVLAQAPQSGFFVFIQLIMNLLKAIFGRRQ